jgi:hypothetical protein
VALRKPSSPLPPAEHRDFQREAIVDLDEVPLPPPPPSTEPMQPPQQRPAVPAATPSRPAPPARAGRVLTRQPTTNEPADLTGNSFVVGTGQSYVGGATTTTGTGDKPAPRGASTPDVATEQRADLSAPVTLPDDDWGCAWPREASEAPIDEQVVPLRAMIGTDGRAESVDLESDPGLGFAAAARECVRRMRFEPARNASGRPIRAKSPLIHIRFTR